MFVSLSSGRNCEVMIDLRGWLISYTSSTESRYHYHFITSFNHPIAVTMEGNAEKQQCSR